MFYETEKHFEGMLKSKWRSTRMCSGMFLSTGGITYC